MVLQIICVKAETAQPRLVKYIYACLLPLAYAYYAIIPVSVSGIYYKTHNSNWSETSLYKKWPLTSKNPSVLRSFRKHRAVMSRTELKCCLISTSYLVGLFCIFILLRIRQNCVCLGDFLTNEDTLRWLSWAIWWFHWCLILDISDTVMIVIYTNLLAINSMYSVLTTCSLFVVKSFRSNK